MLQHWELGQALRQRYQGFLNASYHWQEVRLGAQEARLGAQEAGGMGFTILREPRVRLGTLVSFHAFLVTTATAG